MNAHDCKSPAPNTMNLMHVVHTALVQAYMHVGITVDKVGWLSQKLRIVFWIALDCCVVVVYKCQACVGLFDSCDLLNLILWARPQGMYYY